MARAEELVRLLDMSEQFVDGNKDRNHINGLEHALRTATMAQRWVERVNWQSEEDYPGSQLIFTGLVHDLARPLSDPFHGEVVAEMVRDLVDDHLYHVLRTHGQYQASYVHGEIAYVEEPHAPWSALARRFCGWEAASFNKNWSFHTMTKREAVTRIYKICNGRA